MHKQPGDCEKIFVTYTFNRGFYLESKEKTLKNKQEKNLINRWTREMANGSQEMKRSFPLATR